MEKVILITWPESQECIGCKHGVFINPGRDDNDYVGSTAYLCTIYEPKHNGTTCEDREDYD